MLHAQDFQLTTTGDGYAFDLPERWCFNGRAFGGYTAAMALATMFADQQETGHPHDVAASLSVSFLAPGRPGPVEAAVDVRRAGRSAVALQTTLTQDGTTLLTADAWLADAWGAAPATPMSHGGAGSLLVNDARELDPEQATSLDWLLESWPPLVFGERRGVDYPTSRETFVRGRPAVALWVRALEDTERPLAHPQLTDVLHADAHLFDAPGQITGFFEADLISLDLTLSWQPGAATLPAHAWRLFEARGSVASGAVTAFGSLQSADGAQIAVCTSQGLLR